MKRRLCSWGGTWQKTNRFCSPGTESNDTFMLRKARQGKVNIWLFQVQRGTMIHGNMNCTKVDDFRISQYITSACCLKLTTRSVDLNINTLLCQFAFFPGVVCPDCHKIELTQHSEKEDHGIWSHHFMGNRWGKQWKQCQTLFLGGFQNHYRWWLQPWN